MARRKQRRTFGHVRQLPSGRWQARYRSGPDYTDDRGKVRSTYTTGPSTFATRLEAEAWLANERAGNPTAASRTTGGTVAPRVMFADYSAAWIGNGGRNPHRGLSPRTVDHYTVLRDRLLLPTFGHLTVDGITPALVRAWFAQVDSGPVMRSHAYSLLHSIMASAVDDELIPANPCRLRGAGSRAGRRDVKVLSRAELEALAQACPEQYRLMVLLAAWCAMRQGELVELRRRDVDVEAGTIRVERAVARVKGTQRVGPPKSAAGRRTITMPPHLVPVMSEHLTRFAQPGPDGLLFPATSGKQPQPSSIYKWFTRARLAIGRPDIRFHDLRHTGGTWATQNGATIAEVMARLGHSTPQMAMLYQHAADERDRALAARLSQMS